MDIHSFCIMHKTGVPLYVRNFSDELKGLDFSMVTSMFSALIQFARKVTNSALEVLDMGEYRLFIQEHGDCYYIIISDRSTSILLLDKRFGKIEKVVSVCIDLDEYSSRGAVVNDPNLDAEIDKIIESQIIGESYEGDALRRIFEEHSTSSEFLAGAVLSLKGNPYYSSLPIDVLHNTLKEIEVRAKSTTDLAEANAKYISQTDQRLLFSKVIKIRAFQFPVYLVLLFDKTANLGMADYILEEIIESLSNL